MDDYIRQDFQNALLAKAKNNKIHNYLLYDYADNSTEAFVVNFFQDIFKDMLEQFGHKELEIRIYWISSLDVNACAYKSRCADNTYCIGLFKGILHSLNEYIALHFNNPETDYSDIAIPTLNANLLSIDEHKLGNIGVWVYHSAFMYLLMHEFGHIICGHENEIHENSEDTLLFEENEENEGSYQDQAKEYMADFYGVANSMLAMLGPLKNNPKDFVSACALYSASSFSIMSLFYNSVNTINDCNCEKMTHPHPVVRLLYLSNFSVNELLHHIEMFSHHSPDFEKLFKEQCSSIEDLVSKIDEQFNLIRNVADMQITNEDLESKRTVEVLKRIETATREMVEYYRDKAYVPFA